LFTWPPPESEKQDIKEQLSEQFGVEPGNYLLVFSSRDGRKNIPRTIKAFLSVRECLGDNFKVVVVGQPAKE
jgi:hypothetical protein